MTESFTLIVDRVGKTVILTLTGNVSWTRFLFNYGGGANVKGKLVKFDESGVVLEHAKGLTFYPKSIILYIDLPNAS